MRSDINYFFSELKRQYSPKFLLAFIIFLAILILPIIAIKNKLVFNYSQFANIYLSTIFMSLLIGFILQVFEIYKSSLASYSKIYSLLNSIHSLSETIETKISAEDSSTGIYGELLNYYRVSLIHSFTFENRVNEMLITVYNCHEIEYLIESLRESHQLSQIKKREMLAKLANLKLITKSVKTRL